MAELPSTERQCGNALTFLRQLWVTRTVDHPFWSKVEGRIDESGTTHWIWQPKTLVFQHESARRWAWKDLTQELDLDVLTRTQPLYRRCSELHCVHPAHLSMVPRGKDQTPPLVFECKVNDPFWSKVALIQDADGVEHWLWQLKTVGAAHRQAWNELHERLGLPELPDHRQLYRACRQSHCIDPRHMSLTRVHLVKRQSALDVCDRPIRTQREETAHRYREDPEFRVQVRADLRAKAVARRELGRAAALKKKAAKAESLDEEYPMDLVVESGSMKIVKKVVGDG